MNEKYILHGPEIWGTISKDSLGVQIYQSLIQDGKQEIAFVDALTKETVSFKKLLEVTCILAEALKNAGYETNDVISVSSENSIFFYYPVVAALYLGITVAPINHTYVENELLHVLNLSKPKIIFCSKAVVSKYLDIRKKCQFLEKIIVLDAVEKSSEFDSLEAFMDKYYDNYYDPSLFRPVDVDSKTHVATILCSSGTIGLPKGVMITHANISVLFNQTRDPRLFDLSRDPVKLGFLPFFHGFGFMSTLGSIINKELVVVLSKFEEHSFFRTIQDYKINDLWMVPPLFVLFSKTPVLDQYDLSSLKDLVSSAAPLSKEVELKVKERIKVKQIRQGYGLTETTLGVIVMPPGVEKPGSSGKITPGIKIKIRNLETGRSLGPNQVGEICVKGDLIMLGYINNPEATKAAFTEDGWFLTGDLGYYDKDEYFYIVDRLKELIKYKGFQVAPAELEAILLTHPKISDAAVVGLADEIAGELPLAFVVKLSESDLTEFEVQKFIEGKVSNAKRLRGGVRFVNEIPKNASGKILRRKLREIINTKSKL